MSGAADEMLSRPAEARHNGAMRQLLELSIRTPPTGLMLSLCALLLAAPSWGQTLLGGETTLSFEPSILADLGIGLEAVSTSAAPARAGGLGFAVSVPESQLSFQASGGDFEGFSSADVRHTGGLSLALPGQQLVLDGVRLASAAEPRDLNLVDALGQAWILVTRPHARLAVDGSELVFVHADMLATPAFAALLGRPELADSYLGVLDATLLFAPQPPGPVTQGGFDCTADLEDPVDLELIALYSTTQVAREAGGRVALTFAAELTNNGPGDVAWNRAIDPDGPSGSTYGPHPYLALHMYRLAGGVLQQIGHADVKHAFNAVNDNCPCLGGNVLYAGCDDTYSANTNLNQFFLAPRAEVDAFERSWTSMASHFDGPNEDDFRSHSGSADHDSFEHRLVVQEPDLQTAGASYFVEGWYLTPNDTNLLNSLGHRQITPTFGGSSWAFPNAAAMELGSILDVWVDPGSPGPGEQSERVDTGQGRVQLAAVTGDLGGGVYHYEWALMNFDYESQLRSFSIPILPGMSVTNTDFGDADGNGANDWTVSVLPESVEWTAPAGNELDWGRLYNFRMDVDAAPIESEARMQPLAAGSIVAIPTLAPAVTLTIPALPWPLLAPVLAAAGWLALRRRR